MHIISIQVLYLRLQQIYFQHHAELVTLLHVNGHVDMQPSMVWHHSVKEVNGHHWAVQIFALGRTKIAVSIHLVSKIDFRTMKK